MFFSPHLLYEAQKHNRLNRNENALREKGKSDKKVMHYKGNVRSYVLNCMEILHES